MTEQTKRSIFARNTRIIEAVMARAERICPGALDMIAVTGSFASGDFHETSDLDLLIVIGDERGYKLSHCFILDDVGYDLYCHTWEQLENAAAYTSPYVSKLLDAQMIYCRDDAVRDRFAKITGRLLEHLAAPLTEEDILHALGEVQLAKQAYFDLAVCEMTSYRAPLLRAVYHLECAVYLCCHAVVRHGVRGICAELAVMPSLPDDFLALHRALFEKASYESHLQTMMTMIRNTEAWVSQQKAAVCNRTAPSADALRGTYEELFSNYRNKLILAAQTGDRYLSQMTLGSAGLFFDEIGESVQICLPDAFAAEAFDDPRTAADAFAYAMEQYGARYAEVGLEICRYSDLSAFEHAYIFGDAE